MYRNLEIEILRWAEARQIIPNSTTEKQLLKCVEELGEDGIVPDEVAVNYLTRKIVAVLAIELHGLDDEIFVKVLFRFYVVTKVM